ncbi:hypothetical protein FACS1894187_16800 [Synergistales bacterium]|nr:hypothetical protein FACS1894187_16800 [Synergistales bacterium]
MQTMRKIQVEFINTCPCCDVHARTVEEAAGRRPDLFDVRVYRAGKDFEYLKKYGVISKGTLIIDGHIRIDTLSRGVIEDALLAAAQTAESAESQCLK